MVYKISPSYETFLTQLADLTARRQGWRTSTDRIPRKVRASYRIWIKGRTDLDVRFLLVFVLIYFQAGYHLDVPEALMKDMEDRGWSKNGWATCWGMEWALRLSNTMDRYPILMGDAFNDAQDFRFASQESKPFPGLEEFRPAWAKRAWV